MYHLSRTSRRSIICLASALALFAALDPIRHFRPAAAAPVTAEAGGDHALLTQLAEKVDSDRAVIADLR